MTEGSKHPIHEELKEIFRRALKAQSDRERKRRQREGLRKMMVAPEECFWRGEPPQYRDDLLYIEAVAVAWDYIDRKINGDIRGGEAYNPDRGDASPITLWNQRCKGEYQDRRKRQQKLIDRDPKMPDPDEPFNIDDAPSLPVDIPLLERVRREIETDPTGELKTSFVRKNPPPPITAQAALLAIYDRASRGEKWTNKIIAEQFKIPAGAMNSAWSRTLKPLLKTMGDRLSENIDLDTDGLNS